MKNCSVGLPAGWIVDLLVHDCFFLEKLSQLGEPIQLK
jgi:hypothetical protein